MVSVETKRVVQTNLYGHPAFQAWCTLKPTSIEPERIEILKEKLPRQTKGFKRLVCRLVGVGEAGTAVIGKRCRRTNAMIENTIYKEILPYLPITSLDYYGMLEEPNGEFCWIFLEDAGDENKTALIGERHTLALQWLGTMHTSAVFFRNPNRLPDKGPDHYLKRLKLVREVIINIPTRITLPEDELALLEAIVSQLDFLEPNWAQIQAFCERIPPTLVHGDFSEKNMRVRNGQGGTALLAFDWGEAGWGVPATDVRKVDVLAYWSVVHAHWPWLSIVEIQRLAVVGKIFRCLDTIYWTLPSFNHKWFKDALNNMRTYYEQLTYAIRAFNWE